MRTRAGTAWIHFFILLSATARTTTVSPFLISATRVVRSNRPASCCRGSVGVVQRRSIINPASMNGIPPTTTQVAAAVVASSSSSSPSPIKIAVIGAGAAGLAVARILSREGRRDDHQNGVAVDVTVFEKDGQVGGIWNYHSVQQRSKDRPMYRGLRTNLPKEVMQYREYPWVVTTANNEGGDDDSSSAAASFLSHTKVRQYLQDYETNFDLSKYIQFGTTVRQLTVEEQPSSSSLLSPPSIRWPKIKIEWEQTTAATSLGRDRQSSGSDMYDAVFVCNGHYSQPSVPDIPGLSQYYQGRTIHSISYDDPADYQDQIVLCIGGRASGSDLAREISFHAKEVWLSDTACPKATPVISDDDDGTGDCCPVIWVPKTVAVNSDGTIRFDTAEQEEEKGSSPFNVKPDVIIFCSGYDYSFPFINDRSNLNLRVVPGERRVSPLYKQLWHAQYPNLAFIGLPHSVVPFPLMELQAEAVWTQLQHCTLPSEAERMEEALLDAARGGPLGTGRVQDTHFLGDHQWAYCREMAKLAGLCDDEDSAERVGAYISLNQAIYDWAGRARKDAPPGGPDTYRRLIFQRDPMQTKFVCIDPSKEGNVPVTISTISQQ